MTKGFKPPVQTMRHSFKLPVNASVEDGVLHIEIPHNPEQSAALSIAANAMRESGISPAFIDEAMNGIAQKMDALALWAALTQE